MDKIVFSDVKMLQLLGDFVPMPPIGILPLDTVL